MNTPDADYLLLFGLRR